MQDSRGRAKAERNYYQSNPLQQCQVRKDGKVVAEGDNLISAIRYGVMSLRFGTTQSFNDRWHRPLEYKEVYI